MEAKEKELRRTQNRAVDRDYASEKFREAERPARRDAPRNSAPRREMRSRLVEKRDCIRTFRVESRRIIYSILGIFAEIISSKREKKNPSLSTSRRHDLRVHI